MSKSKLRKTLYLMLMKILVTKQILLFVSGVRGCPAADLANMQMFLMITNLLKTFSFRVPPGDGGHVGTYYEAGTGFLRNPKPFYVVIYNRK